MLSLISRPSLAFADKFKRPISLIPKQFLSASLFPEYFWHNYDPKNYKAINSFSVIDNAKKNMAVIGSASYIHESMTIASNILESVFDGFLMSSTMRKRRSKMNKHKRKKRNKKLKMNTKVSRSQALFKQLIQPMVEIHPPGALRSQVTVLKAEYSYFVMIILVLSHLGCHI